MRNSILLWILTATITIPASSIGAELNDTSKPRFKIILQDLQNKRYQGLLIKAGDSAVSIFPGSFYAWKQEDHLQLVIIPAYQIQKIMLQKKNGLLAGAIIRSGIGLLPLLFSSIVGKGGLGSYLSILTFPLGLMTGGIIGATSRRKYNVAGDPEQYTRFRNGLDE